MVTALARLSSNIESKLIPWKEFTVEKEDVQRIKEELIAVPSSNMLVPMIKSTTAAVEAVKSTTAACGVSADQLFSLRALSPPLRPETQKRSQSHPKVIGNGDTIAHTD